MTYRFLITGLLAFAMPLVAAPSDCRMFEVEVAAVDASGVFHPLFNFGQALPLGEDWSFDVPGESGTLKAAVTWEGDGSDRTPKVALSLRPKDPGAASGAAVLEKLVWDSLFGPEAFTTREGKPLVLPKLGSVFAVASVVPTPCGVEADG